MSARSTVPLMCSGQFKERLALEFMIVGAIITVAGKFVWYAISDHSEDVHLSQSQFLKRAL
jgi:hypothetical protein